MRGLVIFLATLLAQSAFAENCDLNPATNSELQGRSYKVQIFSSASVTVIGETPLEDGDVVMANKLLNEGINDVATKDAIKKLLGDTSTVLNQQMSDRDAIKSLLQSPHPPTVLSVEIPGGDLNKATTDAQALYFKTMVKVKYLGLDLEDLDKVFLLAVGPVIYLKVRSPELFNNIMIRNLDPRKFESVSANNDPAEQSQIKNDVLLLAPSFEFSNIALNLVANCQAMNRKHAVTEGPGPTKAVPAAVAAVKPTAVPVAAPRLRPILAVRAPVFHATPQARAGRGRFFYRPHVVSKSGPRIVNWYTRVGGRVYHHWRQLGYSGRTSHRRRR